MHGRRYLSGRPVTGFWDMFEADRGDPATPEPYARVVPERVGSVPLPFPCPKCGEKIDFSDSVEREKYRDDRPGRGNYYCPHCGNRFYLGLAGPQSKNVGSVSPAVVENVKQTVLSYVEVERTVLGGSGFLSSVSSFFGGYLAGTDVLVATWYR